MKEQAKTVLARVLPRRKVNGDVIKFPPGIARHFSIRHNTAYEKEEWDSIQLFGTSGGCYLDIGANIGIITIAMARKSAAGGKVFAIEGNPWTFGELLACLKLNHADTVVPIQALISDVNGSIDFYLSDIVGFAGRSSITHRDPRGKQLRLPCVTIDELFQNETALDYVKIDIEGAEQRAICGGLKTFQRLRPVIQVEVHEMFMKCIGDSARDLFPMVTSLGYTTFNLKTGDEVDAEDFLSCSHHHVIDPLSKKDLAKEGYGHVVFIPAEREDLRKRLQSHRCAVCNTL